MSISLKKISKSDKKLKALDYVFLEIKQGDLVCFICPYGGGQTTILRNMTSFLVEPEDKTTLARSDV